MIRILLSFSVLYFLVNPTSGLAQTIGQNEKAKGIGKTENGLKTGFWEFFYPDGKLMAQENYIAGMLDGKAESFYPNGNRASLEFWKEDLQEDSAWYFHPNGALHRKGRYESGVYQGQWSTFFPNQKMEQEVVYLDGLPDGPSKNWNESGTLMETGFYKGGKKHGQFSFFNPDNGKLAAISYYWEDHPAGLWLEFNRREKIIRKVWH